MMSKPPLRGVAIQATRDHKSPVLRILTIGLLVAYWLLLFLLTHCPREVIAHINVWDKLAHFIAYAGLAFLLATAVSVAKRPSWTAYAGMLVLVACYGAVDELAQIPVAGRAADLWDVAADVAGAGIGLAGHWLMLLLVDALSGRLARA